jgi:hypothetical protein
VAIDPSNGSAQWYIRRAGSPTPVAQEANSLDEMYRQISAPPGFPSGAIALDDDKLAYSKSTLGAFLPRLASLEALGSVCRAISRLVDICALYLSRRPLAWTATVSGSDGNDREDTK